MFHSTVTFQKDKKGEKMDCGLTFRQWAPKVDGHTKASFSTDQASVDGMNRPGESRTYRL